MTRRRRGYRSFHSYHQPTVARTVKGGIKSHSRRGAFARNWWATRWIAVLERLSPGLDSRLARGRTYARKGQTADLSIETGRVEAKVQGSRAKRYRVVIRLRKIRMESWKKLGKQLAERPKFAAKLLAGEMPEGIEKVFAESGLSLFPQKRRDLATECSCPDWSNPCKHIAAVYYLLGEAFDGDPFLLFRLRGIERKKLLSLLEGEPDKGRKPEKMKSFAPSPLPADPVHFWGSDAPDPPADRGIVIPPLPAVHLRRLGRFPFWRGQQSLIEQLEATYRSAGVVGLAIATGREEIDEGTSPPGEKLRRRGKLKLK